MSKKVLLVVACAIVLVAGALLIGKTGSEQQNTAAPEAQTLKMSGSTTVYPVALKAAEVFMQKHPGTTIAVDQNSTGEGLVQFLNKEIDIANGTRPPKDAEYKEAESKGIDLQMTEISNDAVVVVTNKNNPLTNISREDLKKIFYTGEITDWAQITNGTKTGKINVYGTDPKNSGTAELFTQKVNDKGTFVEGYTILHPTPTVVPKIASDENGIAYTPLKWVDGSVNLLSVDGVVPSDKTILNAAYSLSRKMLIMTDGQPKGMTREFIEFILSEEGQRIVKEEGYIPIY